MTKKITIHWGTDKEPQDKKSYTFEEIMRNLKNLWGKKTKKIASKLSQIPTQLPYRKL